MHTDLPAKESLLWRQIGRWPYENSILACEKREGTEKRAPIWSFPVIDRITIRFGPLIPFTGLYARVAFGRTYIQAGEGGRTLDIHVGNVTLYH